MRFILYLALFPYILALTVFGLNIGADVYSKYKFKKTFIESLNTPTFPNAREILQQFNSYGDNKIVSFTAIENGRPIVIEEMTDIEENVLFEDVAGLAYPKLTSCTIKLRRNLDTKELKDTLLHEYLHCYGYDHVDNPEDLMYYSINPVDKENNIREYAKKLKEEFYE